MIPTLRGENDHVHGDGGGWRGNLQGEMNATLVVSPLNSLDCARINVGRGERETRRRGKMSISTAVAKGDGEGKAGKKGGKKRKQRGRENGRKRDGGRNESRNESE